MDEDMLCPKCHKEGENKMMEIRGTKWYCPLHFLYIDFPVRPLSEKEYRGLLAQKEQQIAELEDEIIELKRYIRKLERR